MLIIILVTAHRKVNDIGPSLKDTTHHPVGKMDM